jgi:hypothetical protein
MKKLIVTTILGALCAGAGMAAWAAGDTVTITGAEYKIELPKYKVLMPSDDFRYFIGSYSLSNGETLSVYERGRQRFAEIGNGGQHEIVAASLNSFVATDRKLKMRIDFDATGAATGELYMVVPAERTASGEVIGEHVVAYVIR